MEETTNRIVDALVSSGLVDPARRQQAADVVRSASAGKLPEPEAPRASSKLGEIAGYAGAALVVAAGVVFIAQEWSSLSAHGRVAWIGAMGLVLAIAGLVASFLGTGWSGLLEESGAVRRRLAGTFYTGTAISAAVAVAVEMEHMRNDVGRNFNGSWSMVATFAVLTVVGIVGYLFAPTIVGLLPIAVGSVAVIPSALGIFNLTSHSQTVAQALLWVALALLWWGLSEIDAVDPRQFGLMIAVTIGLIGAQFPVWSDESPYLGYALTAAVALGGFVGYVARPAWAYIGAGVIGLTFVVPEALHHWTSGSIGTAGSVLLAGVTLLAASLLSFRLARGGGRRSVGSSSEANPA